MSTVYKNLLIALPPKKNPKNNPTSLHKKKTLTPKKIGKFRRGRRIHGTF